MPSTGIIRTWPHLRGKAHLVIWSLQASITSWLAPPHYEVTHLMAWGCVCSLLTKLQNREVLKPPPPSLHLNVSWVATCSHIPKPDARRSRSCKLPSSFKRRLRGMPGSGAEAGTSQQRQNPRLWTYEKALCFSSAGWFVDGHISGAPPIASPDGICSWTCKSPLNPFSP